MNLACGTWKWVDGQRNLLPFHWEMGFGNTIFSTLSFLFYFREYGKDEALLVSHDFWDLWNPSKDGGGMGYAQKQLSKVAFWFHSPCSRSIHLFVCRSMNVLIFLAILSCILAHDCLFLFTFAYKAAACTRSTVECSLAGSSRYIYTENLF